MDATHRPSAQKVNQEISAEFGGQHLGNNIEVGDKGTLEDDRNVRCVEEFDRIGAVLASVSCRLDWQIYSESL